MKKTIVHLMLAGLFLMVSGSTLLAIDSVPLPPYCPPHCTCN
ncbi:MAG TPA: hypothetical protein VG488_01970 [Candidatus Angelobacter sp.]|jgi:hypothetical protein|nr:hypothetical protein [Candidatus Angelobacter sp.]